MLFYACYITIHADGVFQLYMFIIHSNYALKTCTVENPIGTKIWLVGINAPHELSNMLGFDYNTSNELN